MPGPPGRAGNRLTTSRSRTSSLELPHELISFGPERAAGFPLVFRRRVQDHPVMPGGQNCGSIPFLIQSCSPGTRSWRVVPMLVNEVRAHRIRRGWSQEELAKRSGLSRAGISAIETGRLVPSTAAALGLASALGCTVEALFRLPGTPPVDDREEWAWAPPSTDWRYWRAEVCGRRYRFPVEVSPLGLLPHDGTAQRKAATSPVVLIRRGLSCWPAATRRQACWPRSWPGRRKSV